MAEPTLSYGTGDDRAYSQYYRHSGRLGAPGVLLTLGVGGPAAVALGVAQGYVASNVPVPVLDVALTACFGMAIGLLAWRMLHRAKVRNVLVTLVTTAALAGVALYAARVAWLCIELDRIAIPRKSAAAVAVDPFAVARYAEAFNEYGTWELGPRAPAVPSKYGVLFARPRVTDGSGARGGFLTAVWVGEALVLFGGALGVARYLTSQRAYCEACGRWCGKPRVIMRTGVGYPQLTAEALERGRFKVIAGLVGNGNRDRHWAFVLEECGGCKRLAMVSIDDVTRESTEAGYESFKRRRVVHRFMLSPEQLAALRVALGLSAGGTPPPAAEEQSFEIY